MPSDFYKNIKPFSDFRDVLNPSWRHPLPSDWHIVIADIRGSTRAIREGKYKDVNIVGASAIIAVLNAIGDEHEIPYVFGGDGASFAIPPELVRPVAVALLGTRAMAAESFNLDLRAGIVPVSAVVAQSGTVNVSKYSLSENIEIAMFEGGGLSIAESLIKDPVKEEQYDVAAYTDPKAAAEADFGGLECRWNPLKARKGESLTLIAKATGANPADIYDRLLSAIQHIYGTREDYRPARESNLSLSFNPSALRPEHAVQTHGDSFMKRLRYAGKLAFEAVLGSAIFGFDLNMAGVNGKQYKRDAAINTDFQKFDDMLRMVIDGSPAQNKALIAYLEKETAKGDLVFGTNIAEASLMTCLIFAERKRHLHFIDGASGGYALAAAAMKERMKAA